MPKKSRRVAAKQAELGQRKRRAAKHPSGVEAQVPIAQVGAAARVEAPRAAPPPRAPAPDIPRIVPQESSTHAVAPSTLNPYIWPEIKRIGTITGLILIILAVLTVVLR
ncbi:MAG: hypothetical protein ABID84_04465 [Chloroflexota bacterium]